MNTHAEDTNKLKDSSQQHGVVPPTGNKESGGGEGNETSSGRSNEGEGGGVPASGKIVSTTLKIFTLAELKAATRNFRPDTVLGEGGFGRVFKGWVDDKTYAPSKVGLGIAVAVKKSNPDSSQGLQEWQVFYIYQPC